MKITRKNRTYHIAVTSMELLDLQVANALAYLYIMQNATEKTRANDEKAANEHFAYRQAFADAAR